MMYADIARNLSKKKALLGMSDYDVAARSGVSQSTVHRVMSGQYPKVSLENLEAIAGAMGMTLGMLDTKSVEKMRYEEAESKAYQLSDRTQATLAMEGEGLDHETRDILFRRTVQKLLAGPSKKLWTK